MKICTGCKKELPLDNFSFERRRQHYMAQCKSCKSEKARVWRKNKPGYEQERYAKDKDKTRERHLIRKYGVTLIAYQAMLDAQRGKCAICHAPEVEQFKGVFHVDHCHATGSVRGLLCRGCNHMLGVVRDDPEILTRAINYILEHRSRDK